VQSVLVEKDRPIRCKRLVDQVCLRRGSLYSNRLMEVESGESILSIDEVDVTAKGTSQP